LQLRANRVTSRRRKNRELFAHIAHPVEPIIHPLLDPGKGGDQIDAVAIE
jgi:hypothetical protein